MESGKPRFPSISTSLLLVREAYNISLQRTGLIVTHFAKRKMRATEPRR